MIPDWLIRTESDRAAIEEGCVWIESKAERVRKMFRKYLRHSSGPQAGKPFVLADWQYERIIAPLYGWVKPDGLRRFRKAYIEVPKKAGKSTLGAGLAIYGLAMDGEMGAEVISAAMSKEQAGKVFDAAKLMIKASPALSDEMGFWRSEVRHERSNGIYKAIAADSDTADGCNPSLVIFDELHLQKNRSLYDVLMLSQIAREQPLNIAITTAGENLHSVCYETREYAQKIIDGTVINLDFLPVIYSAPKESDWTDENVWMATHPGIGTTINIDSVREVFNAALEIPSLQISFRRYYLNQWLQEESRWIDIKAWSNCQSDEQPESGSPVYVGIDLSLNTDLTAVALVYPVENHFILRVHFWLPSSGIEDRERRDGVPYRTWANQGWMTLCDGCQVDYQSVREYIRTAGTTGSIQEVAYDPWNAAGLVRELQIDGLEDRLIEIRQGHASQAGGSKLLIESIMSGRIRHDGNPCLAWNIGNASADYDANNNVRPSKKKSRHRIDGVMATVNAMCRVSVNQLAGPEEDAGDYAPLAMSL